MVAIILALFFSFRLQAAASQFSDVTGATNRLHTTGRLPLASSGTQYRVMVSIPPVRQPNDPATLTVVPDTQFPLVDKIGSLFNSRFLAVRFTEEVDPATATALSNYIIYRDTDVLPLKSATLRPDGATAILELSQELTNRIVVWAENFPRSPPTTCIPLPSRFGTLPASASARVVAPSIP